MTKRPAPLPSLLFGGALVFGAFMFLRPGILWIAGSVGCIALGWLACPRKPLAIFILGLLCGLISGYIYRPIALPESVFSGKVFAWEGEVVQVRPRAASQVCMVRLTHGEIARVVLCDVSPSVEEHEHITFEGKAEVANPFAALGLDEMENLSPYERMASATIIVPAGKYRIVNRDAGERGMFQRFADKIADFIYTSGLDAESAALLCSAWLGRDDITPDYHSSVRALGLSHLLCVSGMHVGLVALVISILIYPLAYFRLQSYIRYATIVALVWVYVAMTGLQPSAFRAAVMISVFYFVEYKQLSRNTLNSLFLAAAVVVMFNPWWIFAIGFQLSVMAVLGIVVLIPFLNPYTGTHNIRGAKIASAVVLPIAVAITTFPVVVYWFHSISLLSIPTNILAALVFPVFMFAGLLAVMLLHAGFAWAAVPIDGFANLLGRACEVGNTMADGLYVSTGRLVMMLIILTGMLILVRNTRSSWRAIGFTVGVALMIALATWPYKSPRQVLVYSNGSHLTALISGQKEPLYVSTLPTGKPTLSYRRFFALRGYDPEKAALLQSNSGTAQISFRDGMLYLPNDTLNVDSLRHQKVATLIDY